MTLPSPASPPPTAPRPSAGRSGSLSLRLAAAAMVWLVIMLGAGGAALSIAVRDLVEQEFLQRLDAMLNAMVASVEIAPDGRVTLARPLGDPRFEQVFSGWYWQTTDAAGRHVRSRSLWDQTLTTAPGVGLHVRRETGPKGEHLLVAERDVLVSETDGPAHLLIAADLGDVARPTRRFDLLLTIALGALGAGLAAAVVIQVWFGLQPLRRLTRDLNAVRDGDRPRLAGRYPSEVAPLVFAINGLLDKDEALIERARARVGDLAHGLKTPLAVLAAELAHTPNQAPLQEQVAAMRRLIERSMGRATAELGGGRSFGHKYLVRETAQALATALGKIYADRNLAIALNIPADAAFRGHREDLEELLGNLMDNACKFAARRVVVGATMTPDHLTITVDDDGPGLTAEQATDVSRRGVRLDERPGGWGLGLAIVCEIVEAQGGAVTFSTAPDLGGLRVTARSPRL